MHCHRFLSNLLSKKFSMDNVRYGKMRVGLDSGKTVLLVDVEKSVATEIMDKLKEVKLPSEVSVNECSVLPKLIDDDEDKFGRGGGERRFGGGGSRGGDRGGFKGGDRFERRGGGGGDRFERRDGGDRFERRGGRDRDSSPWRR